MSDTKGQPSAPPRHVLWTLLPIVGTVATAFLVTGLVMPVLPLRVHQELGFGTVMVGLVASAQFAASLISRFWSGHYADSRGAKRSVVAGLCVGVVAGLFYLWSACFDDAPVTSVAILLTGRALLGGAESFIVTGALSWGLAIVGRQNTGKVMVWVGTALYVAFAIGAPAGTAIYASAGFVAISVATIVIPLVTLAMVVRLPPVAPTSHAPPSFVKVIGAVWIPGIGLALSSVGFGAITTFIVLLFAQHSWAHSWLAFSLLSVTFIAGRMVFGHLPDRIGGAKVALVCILVEAFGQVLIWLAPSPWLVFLGCALTGMGYSLVYPGFGVEAVRVAPPENRGLAMGAYTAFLDLTLGIAGPTLGWVASKAELRAVYLVSTLVVLCATGFAVRLLMRARRALAAQPSTAPAASAFAGANTGGKPNAKADPRDEAF